jgi:hypothetical protein
MVCPQGWSLPLGMNLAHRGELSLLGRMFTPSFTPSSDHREFQPQAITLTLGNKVNSWGRTSTLGSKFAPGGEVKNGLRVVGY